MPMVKKPELVEMKHPLAVVAFNELMNGLVTYGTYAFYDKGPEEVMELNDLVFKLRAAGASEALSAMKDMARDEVFGTTLVSALLADLQAWNELFELDEKFIEKYF